MFYPYNVIENLKYIYYFILNVILYIVIFGKDCYQNSFDKRYYSYVNVSLKYRQYRQYIPFIQMNYIV